MVKCSSMECLQNYKEQQKHLEMYNFETKTENYLNSSFKSVLSLIWPSTINNNNVARVDIIPTCAKLITKYKSSFGLDVISYKCCYSSCSKNLKYFVILCLLFQNDLKMRNFMYNKVCNHFIVQFWTTSCSCWLKFNAEA